MVSKAALISMKASLTLSFLACALWFGATCLSLAQTYTFTTIAGVAGVSGSEDGTNTDAHFQTPSNLVVDPSGNIFVSDLKNHTIRRMTPQGTNWVVTTIAGMAGMPGSADGTNSDARFNLPHGIAMDRGGVLYVSDYANYLIRQITPMGTNWVVTTIAGAPGVHGSANGFGEMARFWSPWGIAVDSHTNLFVADMANFTIRQLQRSGTNWFVSTIAGTALNFDFVDGTNSEAAFNFPYGITVDAADNLFVTDSGNYAVRKISRSGTDWVVSTIAGTGFRGTNDGPGLSAQFYLPDGLIFAGPGNLLVADLYNNLIRRLELAGDDWKVTTVAGGPIIKGTADGLGPDARFYHPWDIGLDASGNIYITDAGNHTIRKGALQTAFVPSLQIVVSGGQLALSWPQAAESYDLEASPLLAAPGSWSLVTNGILLSGARLVFTNTPATPAMFYRLHRR